MSATDIFDNAPLGSIIGYSNGQPKPPARFVNKLRKWESDNGSGMLIRKEPAVQRPTWVSPASITLHVETYSSGGVVVLTVQHTHCVTSSLEFKIVKRPAAASVLVLQPWGQGFELLHVGADRPSAETWRRDNRHPDAVLDEVPLEAASSARDVGRLA